MNSIQPSWDLLFVVTLNDLREQKEYMFIIDKITNKIEESVRKNKLLCDMVCSKQGGCDTWYTTCI